MGFSVPAAVLRQLRILLFATRPASCGEVLQTAHPPTRLKQSLLNRGASPAKASFGLAGAAAAEFRSHLGYEQSALIPCKPSGTRTNQDIDALDGSFHNCCPPSRSTQHPRPSTYHLPP